MKRIVVLLLTVCSTAYAFPVSGTVHSANGTPIAGAAVTMNLYRALPQGTAGRSRALHPLQGRTDQAGRFAFPNVSNTSAVSSVSAKADGFVSAYAEIDPLPGSSDLFPEKDDDKTQDAPRTAKIVLKPETRLPVRVVDTAGHGIAGLQLYPQQWRYFFPWTLTAAQRDAFARQCPPTDAEGRTSVFHLPQGEAVNMLMRDNRWAPLPGESNKYYPLDKAPVSASQTVTVQPAASLSGHLTTESGRPLAHVWFQLWVLDKGISRIGRGGIQTDKHGEFEIRGLEAGTYNLRIPVDHGPNYVTTYTQAITLTPGDQQTDFHAVCQKGSLLTGRVVDAQTGRPIAGALLNQGIGHVPEVGLAKTDKQGIFRLRVAPGQHFFTIEAPPGFRFPYRWKPSYTLPTTFVNDIDYNVGDLSIALERNPPPAQAALHGKVIDSAGQPVVHATVFYAYAGGRSFVPPDAVLTDSDGNFTIPEIRSSLGSTNFYVLSARRGNWGTKEGTEIRFTGKDSPATNRISPILRLSYLPVATIRGQVVNADGSPAANIPIDVYPAHNNFNNKLPLTDAQGFFQCTAPPESTYFFVARDYNQNRVAISLPILPHSGQWLLLPPLTLQEQQNHDTISLLVVDASNQPVEGATVTIKMPQDSPPYELGANISTMNDGQACFPNLMPGEYEIQITGTDGRHTINTIVGTGPSFPVSFVRVVIQ